jgi:hypothetical protein
LLSCKATKCGTYILYIKCFKEFPNVCWGHVMSINIYPWSMPLPLGKPKIGVGKKFFVVVLNVFPSSSQYVPQYVPQHVPNSSSLNPISSSLVTCIFSPKEGITTCLFWDCEMHFYFFSWQIFFSFFNKRNWENFGNFFSTNFFWG